MKGAPLRVDRYLKEDPERAEAVLQTIWNNLAEWAIISGQRDKLHEKLFELKPWLMDVFRAVRGERD